MNFEYLNESSELADVYKTVSTETDAESPGARCMKYGAALERLVRYACSNRGELSYRAEPSSTLLKLIKDREFKKFLVRSEYCDKIHFIHLASANAALDAENVDEETAELAFELLKEIAFVIFSKLRGFNEQERARYAYRPKPGYSITEAQTRALYIDANLKNAGYKVEKVKGKIVPNAVGIEIEVHNLPNQAVGYADYVIYDKTRLPVAVIEAKKTSVSIEAGAQQAKDYADALAKELGLSYRPIVYYTNGYEIRIQDRLGYPARIVGNFASLADLELLISRQAPGALDKRKPIAKKEVDPTIITRSKLVQAIQSIIDSLNDMRRKGLLVLPCGVGKTRTAVALSKILINNDWVQNVLFLADRNNLVSNALKPFSKYIEGVVSDVSAENPDRDFKARVCVCTYNSMLNLLNQPKKPFSVGRFDLIIVDEAHRSLFNVYRAIFEYFDSFVIGLTATPSTALDRSTYEILDLNVDEPTFEVKFEEAVNLNYLVSFRAFDKTSNILKNGLKYAELSDDEKRKYEETFVDENGEIPESVGGAKFRREVFNSDTIDLMFADLLANGLRVESGTKIGKTLIFAVDHKHAVKIAERFKACYPELGDEFCQVIDNQIVKNKTRQDNFAKVDSNPQIVVSVDMMDTGVDIPEILNLVFFKRVQSRIKFDQMWGRGTRTCVGLRPITPSREYFERRNADDARREYADKQGFFVFDYCDNFNFFDFKPDGKSPSNPPLNLNQKIYEVKLDILARLQDATYQEQPDFRAYYRELKKRLLDKIRALDKNRIDVKAQIAYVEKYKTDEAFEFLSAKAIYEIKARLLRLIDPDTVDDNYSKSLDFRISIIQLSLVDARIDSARQQKQLRKTADELLKKASIGAIRGKLELLKRLAQEDYYATLDFFALEDVQKEIGPLIKYLKGESIELKITNFNDEIETKARDVRHDFDDFKSYREKIVDYLQKHCGELRSVDKILHLDELNGADLEELQTAFNSLKKSDEEDEELKEPKNLIIFVRQILGLDRETIDRKCAAFYNRNDFNEEQRALIDLVIDFAIRNGNVTNEDIANEAPFCNYRIAEIFEDDVSPLLQLTGLFNDALNVVA